MLKNINIYFISIRFLSLYNDIYNDFYEILLILMKIQYFKPTFVSFS